jgi:hypothetical protein
MALAGVAPGESQKSLGGPQLDEQPLTRKTNLERESGWSCVHGYPAVIYICVL